MRPEEELEESGELDEYAPEEDARPKTTGLYCFLNSDRACGAECMAYVTLPRMPVRPELNEQQAHCELLLCFERMGRNITVLAQVAAETVKKRTISEADRRRNAQFTPPGGAPAPGTKSPFPENK